MPHTSTQLPRHSSSRLRRILAAGSASIILLGAVAPAYAEDPPDPNAAIKAETEKAKAETERTKAETEKVKAQMDALGISPAKGETTTTGTAGEMEAYMLSAAAMNEAAAAIATAVGKDEKVIVVGGDDTLDLSLPITLHLQMEAVVKDARALTAAACAAQRPSPPPRGGHELEGLLPTEALAVIGGVVNALKVDTQITGLTVETSNRAFVNAVASNLSHGVVLSEAVQPTGFGDTKIGKDWADLRSTRGDLQDCSNKLAAAKKAELATKLQASLGQIDTFTAAIAKTEASGSLLVRAAILERAVGPKARVLRVASEHAGGSLIKRTSLWTMLGFPAVSLTSGLVASYRLADASTGEVVKSGLLVCRTAHTNLTDVQKGKVGVSACSHALKAGAA